MNEDPIEELGQVYVDIDNLEQDFRKAVDISLIVLNEHHR